MNALSLALALLAFSSAISAALLVRAARKRPRIGALTERAFLAVKDALFGIVCVVLVWNTDTSQALLPLEVARILFRGLLFLNLLIPPIWLVLYLTNRLAGEAATLLDPIRLQRAMRAAGFVVSDVSAEAVAAEYLGLARRRR